MYLQHKTNKLIIRYCNMVDSTAWFTYSLEHLGQKDYPEMTIPAGMLNLKDWRKIEIPGDNHNEIYRFVKDNNTRISNTSLNLFFGDPDILEKKLI